MPSNFKVVPASYVLFTRQNGSASEVLLQLRIGTGYMDGYWAMAAAGHIEQGESVSDAARREAYEELGVTDLEMKPLCAMHRCQGENPIDQRVDYFFLATSWVGVPRIQEPEKCGGLEWFGLNGLPDQLVPHEEFVISRYFEGEVEAIVNYGFNQ